MAGAIHCLPRARHCRRGAGLCPRRPERPGCGLQWGGTGYLIHQFIDSQANSRTDAYGGSLSKRLRFLKEVAEGVIAVVGKERVGVRLAPLTTLNGAVDDTPQTTCLAAASLLNELGVAYIHIAEVDWEDALEMPVAFKQALRLIYLCLNQALALIQKALLAIENRAFLRQV